MNRGGLHPLRVRAGSTPNVVFKISPPGTRLNPCSFSHTRGGKIQQLGVLAMRRTTAAVMLGLGLFLSAPAWTAAHPGDGPAMDGHGHHHGHRHRVEDKRFEADWSAYPAEFQTYKNQLEQLKEQQRGLFEQFKQQREQIQSAHRKLSEAKRNALKTDVKDLVMELKSARDAIHMLSDQKRAAWDQFRQHADAKQWDAAKIDIQTVIARKQEIIAKQQMILRTQQKIVERIQKK